MLQKKKKNVFNGFFCALEDFWGLSVKSPVSYLHGLCLLTVSKSLSRSTRLTAI